VAQLRPAPSNDKEESSDVAFQGAREGAKGGRKRRKQHHQEGTTAADDDGGNDKQAGGSGMVHVTTAAGSGKRQARPPTDHFEKLFDEAYPNHAYAIKHKIRDCGMMKNLMALGYIIRGMELNEVPNEGDVMPFPREDATMMIYDGRPSSGMHYVSNPSPRAPTRCGRG
jgi:hypothetical protein